MMWSYYLRRLVLKGRIFIPRLRQQHLREAMVGPLGHWATLREYQVNALRANGLQPYHRVLDIGCGPLQGGIGLIEYLEPSCYFGVDINAVKLAEGYRQVADLELTHKNPRLLHSGSFGNELLDGMRFDFIWASQILYYFDIDRLRTFLGFVAAKLAPDGRFLGDILGECDPELRSRTHLAWCGSVKRHSMNEFHDLAESVGLQARRLGRIASFGYPAGLSLCSNTLMEVTHTPSPPPLQRGGFSQPELCLAPTTVTSKFLTRKPSHVQVE